MFTGPSFEIHKPTDLAQNFDVRPLMQKFLSWPCPFCNIELYSTPKESNSILKSRHRLINKQPSFYNGHESNACPRTKHQDLYLDQQDRTALHYSEVLVLPSPAAPAPSIDKGMKLIGLGVVTGKIFSGIVDRCKSVKIINLDLAVQISNTEVEASMSPFAIGRVEKQLRTCSGVGSKPREVSVCNIDLRVGDQSIKVALVSSGQVTVTGAKSLGDAAAGIAKVRAWLEHSPAQSSLCIDPALLTAANNSACIETASFRASWNCDFSLPPDKVKLFCSFMSKRFSGADGLIHTVRTAQPGNKSHRLHQIHIHLRCELLPSAALCLSPPRNRAARNLLYVRLGRDGCCHAPAIPVVVGGAEESLVSAAEGRARQVATELGRAIADMVRNFQDEQ